MFGYTVSISCKDNDGAGSEVTATPNGAFAWDVTIDEGDDIVCTITNQRNSTILVQKTVLQGDPSNPGQTFTLDISPGNAILGQSSVLPGSTPVGLGNLSPDTYTVNETNLATGWTLADITCENNFGNSTFGTFTPIVRVQEKAESGSDAAAGDINLAAVSVTLQPVGPGSPVTVSCTASGAVAPFDYNAVLSVECDFSGVPVNTYTVEVTVNGGYYTGSGEDVLTVYDPSLGFTTGGGWFYWPGTTERTNFGYTMKYNKKGTNIQGSLLLIRHLPDGTIYRLKSNALEGLALQGVNIVVPHGGGGNGKGPKK